MVDILFFHMVPTLNLNLIRMLVVCNPPNKDIVKRQISYLQIIPIFTISNHKLGKDAQDQKLKIGKINFMARQIILYGDMVTFIYLVYHKTSQIHKTKFSMPIGPRAISLGQELHKSQYCPERSSLLCLLY